MRLLFASLLAGVVIAPAPTTAQEKPVDKPVMPKLDDKGWVKQKSGLEIWDVVEGNRKKYLQAVATGASARIGYHLLVDAAVQPLHITTRPSQCRLRDIRQ